MLNPYPLKFYPVLGKGDVSPVPPGYTSVYNVLELKISIVSGSGSVTDAEPTSDTVLLLSQNQNLRLLHSHNFQKLQFFKSLVITVIIDVNYSMSLV